MVILRSGILDASALTAGLQVTVRDRSAKARTSSRRASTTAFGWIAHTTIGAVLAIMIQSHASGSRLIRSALGPAPIHSGIRMIRPIIVIRMEGWQRRHSGAAISCRQDER